MMAHAGHHTSKEACMSHSKPRKKQISVCGMLADSTSYDTDVMFTAVKIPGLQRPRVVL